VKKIALAVLLVAAGLVVAYRELRPHAPTIVGSTAVEYVPSPPPRPPAEPGVLWPTYGYDAGRTRAVSGLGLRPPFRRLWTFHARTLLEFPPVVAYGRVYLPTFDGRLIALAATSGRVQWRYVSHRCGWSSPAVARGLVFATFIGSSECRSRARDGEVVAFDARTGRVRWVRRTAPTESSPLVARGTVYVGDWSGRVSAFASASGRLRWTSELDGAIKGSLALAGRRLFIGTYGGDVVSLDARTGRTLWRSGGHGSFYSSPAVAYGRVYIGSLDGGVYAFGAASGRLLWARPTGSYVYASPAIWRQRVLVGSYDHDFYALDAGTGEVRWRFRADGRISGAAAVVDGLVYFSTFAEHTYVLHAADGALVRTWPDGEYSPAVAAAPRLYFVGLGRLSALAPAHG
jgi:outer membrane protein assembly factor BamB